MEINNCDFCGYSTDDLSNFKKHLKSKKHENNVAKNYEHFPKKGSIGSLIKRSSLKKDVLKKTKKKCGYCRKSIYAKNMSRHHKVCKIKKKRDKDKVKQDQLKRDRAKDDIIKEKDKKIEELEQQKMDIETEYQGFIRQIALNNSNKSNSIHTTINMVYVLNHFTEAQDFAQIMAQPPTEKEKKRMLMLGPEYACSDLILSRCVKNVPADLRSLHCTDISRNKFCLYQNNTWSTDYKGEKIIDETLKHMDSIFVNDFEGPIEKKVEYIGKLIDIKKNGPTRKRIMDRIITSTMLSNVKLQDLQSTKKLKIK